MSTFHSRPRRRPASGDFSKTNEPTLPLGAPEPCQPRHSPTTLRKGATFHSPKSPPSPLDDPILDIRAVPQRSPTCPDTLEDLVATHEQRISALLDSIDRSFSGEESSLVADLVSKDSLPVPRFLLDHAVSNAGSTNVNKRILRASSKPRVAGSRPAAGHHGHQHASDSGLGSSIDTASSRDRYNKGLRSRTCQSHTSPRFTDANASQDASGRSSVYSGMTKQDTAINKSFSSFNEDSHDNMLSDFAVLKVRQYIVAPILAENKLKEYHTLIEDLPKRIGDKAIICLRDLEKTLIFLAPVSADFSQGESILTECFIRAKSKARSAASYLNFCEISIQCIHTTVEHLNDRDLRRPADRPYTNNYFVDLIQQVRQYARIMAASRQKQAEGKSLDTMDYSQLVPIDDSLPTHDLTRDRGEKLRLQGGISRNGKPAELVREKDGKMIPIDADEVMMSPPVEAGDDDAERTMARKRKCDIGKIEWRACRECGKEFTRSCDLTKHEKTHSRPWKCPQVGCKYHELGWPTEKECDRHVNDKHSSAPPLYKCLYTGCTYTSKRESNCKQHMEKAHGWDYVRSKSKKGVQNLVPTSQTSPTNLMPTPQSAHQTLSSPASTFFDSPANASSDAFSPSTSIPAAGSDLFRNNNDSNASIGNEFGGAFGIGEQNGESLHFGGFPTEFQSHGQPPSPEASEGHSDSLFGPMIDYSNIDSSLPTSAWESDLNFGDMNCDNPWPPVTNFFPQYNTVQQPTPAMSDFNFDCNGTSAEPQATAGAPNMHGVNLSPGASGDLMLCDSRDSMQSENSMVQRPHDNNNNDFPLFGEVAGGESSNLTSMFPDLGNVGHQFDNHEMMDMNDFTLFPSQQQ